MARRCSTLGSKCVRGRACVVGAALLVAAGAGCVPLPPSRSIRTELSNEDLAKRLDQRFPVGLDRRTAEKHAASAGLEPVTTLRLARLEEGAEEEEAPYASRAVYEIKHGSRRLWLLPVIYDDFNGLRYLSLLFDDGDRLTMWRVWPGDVSPGFSSARSAYR